MNELRFFFFSPDGRRIGSFCSFGIKMATTIAKATINAPNTRETHKMEHVSFSLHKICGNPSNLNIHLPNGGPGANVVYSSIGLIDSFRMLPSNVSIL